MYVGWERKDTSIRAWRGRPPKYRHNCPIKDFIHITKIIFTLTRDNNKASRKDLFQMLEGKKLPNGSIFTAYTQSYKITLVFSVLLLEGFIKRKGLKHYEGKGRAPYGYVATNKFQDMKFVSKYFQEH